MPKLTPEQMGKVLLDLADEADLESADDMTDAEVDASARAAGVDVEKTRAAARRIIDAAEKKRAARAEARATAPSEAPRVVRLDERRATRAGFPRWTAALALAAAILIFIGIANRDEIFGTGPHDIVTHPVTDPADAARKLVHAASEDAANQRWEACLDKLGRAEVFVPELRTDPEVEKLRRAALLGLAEAGPEEAAAPGAGRDAR
jgi:hypothetical protein